MKKLFILLFIISTLTSCNITSKKNDYVLKSDNEYYYKVCFNMFNEDSTIVKIHKPVEYITIIEGRGSKRRVSFYGYNGKYFTHRYCPWVRSVRVGSKVKLRHYFEPTASIFDELVEVIEY